MRFMPVNFARKNESGLNGLAKNAIRLENKVPSEVVLSELHYHAIASLEIWVSVANADLRKVRFYLENGFNSNLHISANGKTVPLVKSAKILLDNAPTKAVRKNLDEIIEYLSKRPMEKLDNAVFEIVLQPGNEIMYRYSSRLGRCSLGSREDQ
ncbi:MAG: hypothetical protein KGH53_03045 [Candidatus Micrarchaeota archaeon]|nr:hypothetical protein [Candidatus Micrarchaeota archaeon]